MRSARGRDAPARLRAYAFCPRAPWGIIGRRTQIIGCASSGEATPMPKVLIIQPFHEDGMKLFAARPDVTYEVVDGTLEELAEKIADADGVTIRTSPLPAERAGPRRAPQGRLAPRRRLRQHRRRRAHPARHPARDRGRCERHRGRRAHALLHARAGQAGPALRPRDARGWLGGAQQPGGGRSRWAAASWSWASAGSAARSPDAAPRSAWPSWSTTPTCRRT